MNKNKIYKSLKALNVEYTTTKHQAVFNMQELTSVYLPYPDLIAKNLFVRDDKKENYYLIVVKGDKRVDLKNFREKYNTRRLSMASASELEKILKLHPGEVSPFGL